MFEPPFAFISSSWTDCEPDSEPDPEPLETVVGTTGTGNTVVATATVWVVADKVFDRRGQSVTDSGQARTVAVCVA